MNARFKNSLLTLAVGYGALGSTACAGPITNYKFPERSYDQGSYDVDRSGQTGLLWGEHTQTAVEDNRSRRLGEIVIVMIEERSDASGSANTETSSESSVEAGIEHLLGAVERWAGADDNISQAALLKAALKNSYKGNGKTARNDTFEATIPCQVKKVLPNGDLFIEGGKTLQVNAEESHLYLSGVVRPQDIAMNNTVSSNRVLDARVDFSGRGVISDKQSPGLLHRGMDAVWPF